MGVEETTCHDVTSVGVNWTEQERLEKLSYETFVTLLPTVLFVVTLILVGVPGNLLVILVYLKRFKASATRVFVVALGVCDLTIDIFTLPRHLALMRFSYLSRGEHYCRVVGTLAVCPIVLSYWLLVCVALDRRRRICRPLQRQLSSRQALHVLLVPVALTGVIIVPFTPLQQEGPLQTGVPGLNGTTCSFPTDYYGMDIRRAFRLSQTATYSVIFPLLAFSYGQILRKVCQTRAKRLSLCHSPARAQQKWPTPDDCRISGQVNSGTNADTTQTNNQHMNTRPSDSPGESNYSVEGARSRSGERARLREPLVERNALHSRRKGEEEKREVVINQNDSRNKIDEKQEEISSRGQQDSPACLFGANGDGQVRSTTSVTSVSSRDTCRSHAHLGASTLEMQTRSGDAFLRDPCTAQSNVPSPDGEGQAKAESGSSSHPRPQRQRKKGLSSQTTLTMFVLTIATGIFCLPYFVVELTQTQYVRSDLSSCITNMLFLARICPSINSAVSPFIYCFCNANFRLQCRRFLNAARRNVLLHT